MVIFVLGPMGSGKTTLANALIESTKLRPISIIKEHTTRPRRYPEEDSLEFVDPTTFSKMNEEDAYIGITRFTATFGNVSYAILKRDLLMCRNQNGILVTNLEAYYSAREYCALNEIPMFTILLDPPQQVLYKHARLRGDNEDEVRRRLRDESVLFDLFAKSGKVDLVVGVVESVKELRTLAIHAVRRKIVASNGRR